MCPLQRLAVTVAIGLMALDGFDVLSISFAAPGIAAEWDINRAALGVVLSMELIGMAAGSILLGRLADRVGRRPTALACLAVMALGMFGVTQVHGIAGLRLWRCVSGLGIGGMLAISNAIAAEFSNARRRHLCVALMAVGYPLGAAIGGSIVHELLLTHDWRSIFYLGAAATAAFIPIVWMLVPESVPWLSQAQPPDALQRINAVLTRMGYRALPVLPPTVLSNPAQPRTNLFARPLLSQTLLCTAAYFFQIATFYFLLKWIPKIVVDMGFPAADAAGVLMWANIGGAAGGLILGLASQRVSLRRLTVLVMLSSAVSVVLFGRSSMKLQELSMLGLIACFFTNACIVGLYAVFAEVFPANIRASGTGFAIGVGRGASVVAPILAGLLFDRGYTLPTVATIMAAGSILAAGCLIFVTTTKDALTGLSRSPVSVD